MPLISRGWRGWDFVRDIWWKSGPSSNRKVSSKRLIDWLKYSSSKSCNNFFLRWYLLIEGVTCTCICVFIQNGSITSLGIAKWKTKWRQEIDLRNFITGLENKFFIKTKNIFMFCNNLQEYWPLIVMTSLLMVSLTWLLDEMMVWWRSIAMTNQTSPYLDLNR